jgi:hypothetical protein
MDMVVPPTHTQTRTSNTSYTTVENKPIFRVHFWDEEGKLGFINLNPGYIQQLQITSETILTEEIISTPNGPGILLRCFRNTPT